jgi:hypothetical protein
VRSAQTLDIRITLESNRGDLKFIKDVSITRGNQSVSYAVAVRYVCTSGSNPAVRSVGEVRFVTITRYERDARNVNRMFTI